VEGDGGMYFLYVAEDQKLNAEYVDTGKDEDLGKMNSSSLKLE
jgi:hypothetical protein